MRLKGKVAIITGAARGIGLSAAKIFAREGARVVVADIADTGAQVVDEIVAGGREALFVKTDVSSEKAVVALFEKISRQYGALHVLYANAGIFLGKRDGRITKLSMETWETVMRINLGGTFLCCKHGIPLIIASGGGSVITTSSSAGVIGVPGCDAYTATKGAIISLTRSMAVEYGPRGVRVNCIAPCAIETPMNTTSAVENPDFDEKGFLEGTPLRRYGTPEDVAYMALFLASDESAYSTGGLFMVDGANTVRNWSY